MSSIDELLQQIPIGQLAGKLGLSEDETKKAVNQALPALVGGMAENAKDPLGAASLERALAEHDGTLIEGGIDLDQVDTVDGEKIVKNVFGDNEEAVVNQLGGLGGGAGTMASLLPMLAPLLMSFLGRSSGGGGGGLGNILGGLLGGGGGGGDDAGGGGMGDIGDVLGGLLGGGKR